jgi:crotonobetainyl-CoA:carnitine CoA-transferase CaiB-like acyl-CoA transferase
VFADPHYRENDWLIEAPVMPGISGMDSFVTRGPYAKFSKQPGTFRRAPDIGEHNYEIMARYGLSGEEVDRLQAKWAKA